MTVAILDARGVLKAFAAEDGTPLRRADIAIGKAYGALAMGAGSRSLQKRAELKPYFIAAATQAVGGSPIPVRGGVLIRGDDKEVIGAIGATGDASDNDEAKGAGWPSRRKSCRRPQLKPTLLERLRIHKDCERCTTDKDNPMRNLSPDPARQLS
jgi:uncharacterized protein GlcG (DUF336 family)